MDQDGHRTKGIVTSLLVPSLLGFIAAAATYHHRYRRKPQATKDDPIIPRRVLKGSGRLGNLEKFSHYVARQIGFEDPNECPQLCKLAYDCLKKTEGCEASMFDFFSDERTTMEAEVMYGKLVEEFDRCILTYFAFNWTKTAYGKKKNWTKTSLVISQVLDVESVKKPKLKSLVMAATRKQRFQRVSKDLHVTRLFSTLVEEMKVIHGNKESECTDVMKPVALSKRSPVLLLMGGGMGAGKSTITKEILNEPFWSGAKDKAVVVEADAFKETDVIYRALSSRGHPDDMLPSAELVHQSSSNAASSLLVTALNEGRDVIMDGTLSWEPFVEQTIAMARNVHKCRYRMGDGYGGSLKTEPLLRITG